MAFPCYWKVYIASMASEISNRLNKKLYKINIIMYIDVCNTNYMDPCT